MFGFLTGGNCEAGGEFFFFFFNTIKVVVSCVQLTQKDI